MSDIENTPRETQVTSMYSTELIIGALLLHVNVSEMLHWSRETYKLCVHNMRKGEEERIIRENIIKVSRTARSLKLGRNKQTRTHTQINTLLMQL